MSIDEYMTSRVDNQMNWFSDKSGYNQMRFKRLKTITLVTSGLIPFLSGAAYLDFVETYIPAVVGLLGVVIAVAEGLLSIHKYQENWLQYRITAEALKREKFLFSTQAGPYTNPEHRFPYFVERIESIIQDDNVAWKSYSSENDNDGGGASE